MESPYLIMRIINRIPICGGFCAPTVSPETSCLRHFSNEWTPPQPCFRKPWLRCCFEHATVPRLFGRIGLPFFERHRARVMLVSFTVSFVAWAFTIFACCALTDKKSVLRNAHWIKLTVDKGSAVSYMGLSHIGTRLFGGAWSVQSISCGSITFFSRTAQRTATIDDIFDTSCTRCKNAASDAVSLAISGAITQVFQMTTELQRSTRWGDLNCQKLFGVCTSIYGLISTVQSLRSYRADCGLQSDVPPWGRTRQVPVDFDDGTTGSVEISVEAGLAYALLFIAVWLKALDALLHLLVPTPKEKQIVPTNYDTMELEEYMNLVVQERPSNIEMT